jgi:hypothetical protein
MVPAGDDDDLVLGRGIDQPVLVVDTARPEAGEICLERLWFADSFKG